MNSPIILPNTPLYNLLPFFEADAVRHLMQRAIQVSHEETLYGRFASYAYTGSAASLALIYSVGFYLRSNVRLITAILYINSLNRERLFNEFTADLNAAYNCLVFTAAATACIFASLFFPSKFNFKDTLPISPNDDHLAVRETAVALRNPSIDPELLRRVIPHVLKRGPSIHTPQIVKIPYNGSIILVNVADPRLHAFVAKELGRPLLSIEMPCEIPINVGNTTIYIDAKWLRGSPDQVMKHIFNCFKEQEIQKRKQYLIEQQELNNLTDSFVMVTEEEMLEAAHKVLERQEPSFAERLRRLFHRQDHITKKMKYREFLRQMRDRLQTSGLDIAAIRVKIDRIKPADGDLKVAAQKFCRTLYGSDDDTQIPSKDEKKSYQEMVDALREIWSCASYQNGKYPEISAFFQQAFLLRYTLDFGQFYDELVTFASGSIPVEKLSLQNLWQVFSLKNQALHNLDPAKGGIAHVDRYAQMFRGEVGYNFDASRETNHPNRNGILSLQNGAQIHLLRHGTPIRQGSSGTLVRALTLAWQKVVTNDENSQVLQQCNHYSKKDTEVNEDFLGFMQAVQVRGEKILHVVLENNAVEQSRRDQRLSLETDTFFPAAFSMDGSFFNGKKKFTAIKTFKQLRGTLISHLVNKKGNFYLSQKILPSEAVLKTLFIEVQQIFFNGRADIVRSEACDEYKAYLLFCYTYLTLHLLQVHGITYLSGGCKDFLDRGGVFAATLNMIVLFLLEKEDDHESLKDVLNNLWAPPVAVKKKGVVPERAELFRYTLQRMTQMTPENKDHLRSGRFNGWLRDFTVPKVKDQGIYPSGTTAMTLEEYNAFISRLTQLKDQQLEVLKIKPGLLDEFSQMKEGRIRHQIDRDRQHIFYGEEETPIVSSKTLEDFLQQNGIQDPSIILRVLSGAHQGIANAVTQELQNRFNNPQLKIELLQDTSSAENLKIFVKVRHEENSPIVSIHMEQIYRLIQGEGSTPLHKIIGTTTIADHRIGLGEIRCGVLAGSS